MNRKQKLQVHLEMVIWEDLPEGIRLNAAEIEKRMETATHEQKARAYRRALTRSPLLLDDERAEGGR